MDPISEILRGVFWKNGPELVPRANLDPPLFWTPKITCPGGYRVPGFLYKIVKTGSRAFRWHKMIGLF